MTCAARCPLEECAAPHAGRGDGRAATACARVERGRPPLSLWWLVSGSRLSRGGGSDGVIFPLSVVQSLRLCCVRNVVFVDEYTDMVVTTTTTTT